MTILLLEDDLSLGETIKDILIDNGYSVDYVTRGNDAIEYTYKNRYDIYIFDINVPDIDGLEILESLRDADDNTPAIFISAMTDLQTILKGFKVGADDFIKKPFYPEELLVKIELKLRKKESITCNDISFYPNEKRVVKGENSLHLSGVQYRLFEIFMNNINRVITLDELYEELKKPSINALRFHINKLKNSTGLDIKNIRGSGYILEKS